MKTSITQKDSYFNLNLIQHSQYVIRILKSMESMVHMRFSIVIMTSSYYGSDNINKLKNLW